MTKKRNLFHNSSGKGLMQVSVDRILMILDRLKVWERWPMLFRGIQVNLSVLYGPNHSAEHTRIWTAELLVYSITLTLAWLLLGITGDPVLLQTGWILVPAYGYYRRKKLSDQVRKRQRAIILELPELLNKLILLMNAGETIHQAIHRCAPQPNETCLHPLRQEWLRLSRELKDNKPFLWAMEEFSRACGVIEVSMFSTAVLLNFKRGGTDFVTALQDLSRTLWERRKATARTIGEETSAKLVFPMVLLFCTVMVIVAAPAVLMMN